MPNRHENTSDYRYGFQGQELDNELKGEGNSVNYKYRMHDPRVGRFFAVDPLSFKYAYNSPYAFAENKVVQFNELEGLEINPERQKRKNWSTGKKIALALWDTGVSNLQGLWTMVKNPDETIEQSAQMGWTIGQDSYGWIFGLIYGGDNEDLRNQIMTAYDNEFGATSAQTSVMLMDAADQLFDKVQNGDAYERTQIGFEVVIGLLGTKGGQRFVKISQLAAVAKVDKYVPDGSRKAWYQFLEKSSVFNNSGGLHPDIIAKSRPIVNGNELGNQSLIKQLTADGSDIGDWSKMAYKIDDVGEVHYYYNHKSKTAFYDTDYKVTWGKDGDLNNIKNSKIYQKTPNKDELNSPGSNSRNNKEY